MVPETARSDPTFPRYDRKALTFRRIIDCIYVCACGPPGGGRNPLSARFPRHFNTVGYTPLLDESMKLIFNTILNNYLQTSHFTEVTKALAGGVVDATVSVYNTILADLRPTPAKSHYQFNLRDISKVAPRAETKVSTPLRFGAN